MVFPISLSVPPAPLRSATPGPSRSEGVARAEERGVILIWCGLYLIRSLSDRVTTTISDNCRWFWRHCPAPACCLRPGFPERDHAFTDVDRRHVSAGYARGGPQGREQAPVPGGPAGSLWGTPGNGSRQGARTFGARRFPGTGDRGPRCRRPAVRRHPRDRLPSARRKDPRTVHGGRRYRRADRSAKRVMATSGPVGYRRPGYRRRGFPPVLPAGRTVGLTGGCRAPPAARPREGFPHPRRHVSRRVGPDQAPRGCGPEPGGDRRCRLRGDPRRRGAARRRIGGDHPDRRPDGPHGGRERRKAGVRRRGVARGLLRDRHRRGGGRRHHPHHPPRPDARAREGGPEAAGQGRGRRPAGETSRPPARHGRQRRAGQPAVPRRNLPGGGTGAGLPACGGKAGGSCRPRARKGQRRRGPETPDPARKAAGRTGRGRRRDQAAWLSSRTAFAGHRQNGHLLQERQAGDGPRGMRGGRPHDRRRNRGTGEREPDHARTRAAGNGMETRRRAGNHHPMRSGTLRSLRPRMGNAPREPAVLKPGMSRNQAPYGNHARGKGPALRFPRPPTPPIPHGNGSVPSDPRLTGASGRRKACRQARRGRPAARGGRSGRRRFPQGGRASRNASAGVR